MSVAGGDWLQGFPWLQSPGLESPFVWAPTDLLPPSEAPGFLAHLKRKIRKSASAEKVFTINMFVLNLVIGYELASSGNITAALGKMQDIENDLRGVDLDKNNSSLCHQARRPMSHVIMVTKAVLLAHNGSIEESKQLLSENFIPLSSLSEIEHAAMCGVKSSTFLLYGARGGPEALRLAKQAVYKNPKEPEWHMLAGQSLEAIRRAGAAADGLPAEELAHFEQAVVLSSRSAHALRVARVYSRLARDTLAAHAHDPIFKTSALARQMSEASRRTVQLYQKALELEPNCTDTQVACLEGMLKLPRQFLSNDQLKSLVESISASPNKSVSFYNAAATFYLKIERQNLPALRLFDEGADRGDHACSINALRLRIKMRQDVDPELTLLGLERRLRNADDPSAHETALAQLVGFYLLRDHNLELALENGNRLLEINPASKALLVHRPVFVRSLKPLNLLVILLNEVRAADVVPGRAAAPAHLREPFMRLVARHWPDLLQRPVDVHLVDKLADASDRLARKKTGNRKFTSDRYYPYS